MQRTRLSDFDFHLPPELLAEHPAPTRDGSRLMVVHRESGRIEHRSFPDIQSYFGAGDCLILNNTQVVPARMEVRKNRMDGALIELLLVEEVDGEPHTWNVLLDPLKKLRLGHRLVFGNHQLEAEIVAEAGERERHIRFDFEGSNDELRAQLYQLGCTPLPRYIKRPEVSADAQRYQTVYASEPGALAAPTAGLHFTPQIMHAMEQQGVHFPQLTLQIGIGTFTPVHEEDITQHQMHTERFFLPEATATSIRNSLENGHKACAVGTTVLRTLESTIKQTGRIAEYRGSTKLFIYPPYNFQSANALLTNFHTPQSTLLMLVCAYGGYELMMDAYREAVREGYRFFSFGDAMLII